MRVHIDGLLPLIKESVVEYPNGDEVTTTLVYERLDKHCTKCLRLDHELKECLVARAEAKALKAAQEEQNAKGTHEPRTHGNTLRGELSVSNQSTKNSMEGDQRIEEVFQFSASNRVGSKARKQDRDARENVKHRTYKTQSTSWQERSSQRRSSQVRERSRYEVERPYRTPRENQGYRHPTQSYYREVQRKQPTSRDHSSSLAKSNQEVWNKGNPSPNISQNLIPQEVLKEARVELRDVMLQYTKTADPTEREARLERVRQAEEQGQMEESVIQIARASMSANAEKQKRTYVEGTPERIPATKRLGPNSQQQPHTAEQAVEDQMSSSQERIPVSLRLGPVAPVEQERDAHEELISAQIMGSNERISATLRLGPMLEEPGAIESTVEPITAKKRLGRPPGRKNQEKTKVPNDTATKIRRVTQSKGSPARRRTTTKQTGGAKPKRKTGPSYDRDQPSSTTSSENRPLCNMIPARVKKRMDFRIPSAPVP